MFTICFRMPHILFDRRSQRAYKPTPQFLLRHSSSGQWSNSATFLLPHESRHATCFTVMKNKRGSSYNMIDFVKQVSKHMPCCMETHKYGGGGGGWKWEARWFKLGWKEEVLWDWILYIEYIHTCTGGVQSIPEIARVISLLSVWASDKWDFLREYGRAQGHKPRKTSNNNGGSMLILVPYS